MIFGNVEDSFKGKRNVRSKVHFVLVFLCSVGEVFEELLILFLGDLIFCPCPDRFDEVDDLVVDDNWEIYKVGVFLDDLLNVCLLQKWFALFFHVEHYLGSSLEGLVIVSFRDVEGSRAIAFPQMSGSSFFP